MENKEETKIRGLIDLVTIYYTTVICRNFDKSRIFLSNENND